MAACDVASEAIHRIGNRMPRSPPIVATQRYFMRSAKQGGMRGGLIQPRSGDPAQRESQTLPRGVSGSHRTRRPTRAVLNGFLVLDGYG